MKSYTVVKLKELMKPQKLRIDRRSAAPVYPLAAKLITLLLLFILSGKSFAENLFPILKDGRWGYIDKTGKIVIQPQFEKATEFFEELAPVRLGGKWGYIDKSGQWEIPAQFSAALHFREGIGLVARKSGFENVKQPLMSPAEEAEDRLMADYVSIYHGLGFGAYHNVVPALDDDGFIGSKYRKAQFAYIDKHGKVIFDMVADYACKFHEGLAAVSIDEKAAYIDLSGKIALQTQYKYADSFLHGLARAQPNAGGKWGYIGKTGEWSIKPQFDEAGPFQDDVAMVNIHSAAFNGAMQKAQAELKGQTSSSGKMEIIASRPVKNSPPFCIDTSGQKVDGPINNRCKTIIDGISLVRHLSADGKSTKYGYADASGKIIIQPQFDEAEEFHNGLAAVRIGRVMHEVNGRLVKNTDSKLGYVNESGEYVWNPTN